MKKYKYHVIILLSAFCYASLSIFSAALTVQKINVFDQIFWRIVLGSLISFFISVFVFRKISLITLKVFIYLFINAIIFLGGFTTFSLSIYLGTPIAKAVALNYAYPIPVLLFSYFLFKEKPTKKGLLAVFLSIISIYLLLEIWTIRNFAEIHLGDLLAFVNSIFFAGIIVFGRKIRKDTKLNSFESLSYTLAFMLPMLFLLAYVLHIPVLSPKIHVGFSPVSWLTLIGLATLGTVAPLGFLYIGMSKIKAYVASILLITEPVWVYVAGLTFFKESLTFWGILGIVGIIVSVLLV